MNGALTGCDTRTDVDMIDNGHVITSPSFEGDGGRDGPTMLSSPSLTRIENSIPEFARKMRDERGSQLTTPPILRAALAAFCPAGFKFY